MRRSAAGSAAAARTIDATGKFLAPGFIDIHSHSDRGLGDLNLRYNINMVAQGITLSVVNQDGRSPWPIRDQKARYEKQGVGSNVALMVGHGAVRTRVMGARANQVATDADITAMQGARRGGDEGWRLRAEHRTRVRARPLQRAARSHRDHPSGEEVRRLLHQPRAQRRARSDVARGIRSDAVCRPARRGEGDDRHRPRDRRAGGLLAPQGEGRRLLGREPRRDAADSRGARTGDRGLRGSISLRHVRQRRIDRAHSDVGAGAAGHRSRRAARRGWSRRGAAT